jgi:hypothetical protein|tara:strand:- start:5542 stop:5808 length:267 start_codon:yes stop_codon:yes gene_type:complete
MLLPEGGVDLQVRGPEVLFDLVGGGVFEVGEGEGLAGGAVPEALVSSRGAAAVTLLLLEEGSQVGACGAVIGTLVQLMLDCLRPPGSN